MAAVQTVLGAVEPDALGFTLTHEHLFIGWPGWDLDPVPPDQKREQYGTLVGRLRAAHASGVRTIVDASPSELGRDMELLCRLSQDTGIHIIASTGFYHEAWGLPVYLKMRTVEELAEILLFELARGVGAPQVRPGAIKIAASGQSVGKHETKALLAAATASKATGAAILTHAAGPAVALEQATRLVAEGVRPGAVQIGHCDGFTLEDIEAVLRTGVTVAFDQVVYQHTVTVDQRVTRITELLARGWEDQLTLSHDQIGILGGRQVPLAGCTREFTYLHNEFLPALRDAGLTPAQEARLTVTNSAAWLGGGAHASNGSTR